MTIAFDDGTDPVNTDLSMQLGARGELLKQDEAGGMGLALRADAFFVWMESEKAANSAATSANASRLRLVLEGGCSFDVGGSTVVRPALELGVRHDGGDAEIGTGVEVGCGVSYADPVTSLSLEATVRTLVVHADSEYREWGASATARLDPGEPSRSSSRPPSARRRALRRGCGVREMRGLSPRAEARSGRRRASGARWATAWRCSATASPARPVSGSGSRGRRARSARVGVWRRRRP